MATRFRSTLIGVLSLGMLSGCGGDGAPMGPGGENGPVTARINGSSWAADAILSYANYNLSENLLVIYGGSISTYGIAITLDEVDSTGTYTLGITFPLRFAVVSTIAGGSWASSQPGGSGSVTITTFNQNRVAGTFQWTSPAQATSTEQGTLTVTNGQFDLAVTRLP